jgi:hypothetical protein
MEIEKKNNLINNYWADKRGDKSERFFKSFTRQVCVSAAHKLVYAYSLASKTLKAAQK